MKSHSIDCNDCLFLNGTRMVKQEKNFKCLSYFELCSFTEWRSQVYGFLSIFPLHWQNKARRRVRSLETEETNVGKKRFSVPSPSTVVHRSPIRPSLVVPLHLKISMRVRLTILCAFPIALPRKFVFQSEVIISFFLM